MRLATSPFLLCSLAGLSLWACGGGGSVTPSVDAGLTPEAACGQSSTATCALLDRCLNDAGVSERYGDLAACQARLKANCQASLAAPGMLRTSSNVAACAAAVTTESCGDSFDNNPPVVCQAVPGQLAPGAPCGFSSQCASAFCAIPRNANCGTCATAPGSNADCTLTGACAPGQVCAALATGTTSQCVTPGAVGATCDKALPCQAGLGCVAPRVDGGVGTGTCAALGTSVGMPCDPLSRTEPACDLDRGLFCSSASRTCQTAAYVGPGAPCGSFDGGVGRAVCAQASTCENLSHNVGTCLARAAEGTSCDTAQGPICMAPARCLVADGGTRGTCGLPTATCP